jgi:hypothetical protein
MGQIDPSSPLLASDQLTRYRRRPGLGRSRRSLSPGVTLSVLQATPGSWGQKGRTADPIPLPVVHRNLDNGPDAAVSGGLSR